MIIDCNNCKHNDLKSCRYPCSECHWALMDKWENDDWVKLANGEWVLIGK